MDETLPTKPSEPAEDENDFISLSASSDLLAETLSILDPSMRHHTRTLRSLRQPVPPLRTNVSSALQHVKTRLEANQNDSLAWVLYLKLFLALGLDLRPLSLSFTSRIRHVFRPHPGGTIPCRHA